MSNSTLVGLMPAPPGVIPDFNIHHMTSMQLSFFIAYGITLGMATLTLCLRLYTRFCIVRSFGLDDIALLLAMGCSLTFLCISIDMMKYGLGRHLWEVTAVQLGEYLKHFTPWVAAYAWAPAFTKLSIILLLDRLNPTIWLRLAHYVTAFIIIGYTLAITLIIAIPCNPRKSNNGECFNNCSLWQAVLNIITDVLILLLPVHMLYRLNLHLRQKLALASVFSTGIFVIIICIVRITYIMSLRTNPDVTYSEGRAAVWSCVEINIGIFCNTVVVLKPFLRKYFPTFFDSYITSTNGVISGGAYGKQRSYQLSSIENRVTGGEGNGVYERAEEKGGRAGIVVTNSYEIETATSSYAGKSDGNESTEEIIQPGRKK